MNNPDDDELLLFHLGEELGPERMDAIACAIATDPRLAARYAALRRILGASTLALAPPDPGADFEQRLWVRLAPALQPAPTRRRIWWDWLLPTIALAASVAFGVYLGGAWRKPAEYPQPAAYALTTDAPDRVLAAHLTRHLAQTERLLRVAENGEGGTDALAAALIDSNRIYAAAAERAGKPALAQFLIELEPILRELSNARADAALGGAELARDEIRSRDLLFRLRTLETLQISGTQRL